MKPNSNTIAWRCLALTGLLALLAACGGSDDSTPAPPPAVAAQAPVIVTPPQSQSVTAGATATFNASVTGSNLSYQWLRGGSTIAGATAASYTTPATTPADNGASFSLRACSGTQATGTCVTSAAATLTVTAPIGVGPSGGTVDGPNGARAVIPAGALSTFVDIRVAAAGAGTPAFPPSGITAIGGVYAFTPHGTAFTQPATVRVPFDPAGSGRRHGQRQLPRGAGQRLFVLCARCAAGTAADLGAALLGDRRVLRARIAVGQCLLLGGPR
ncbi:MAG: hypothetical protein MUC68_18770 [Burkholderiaceae bacterium]|nr:hypothetical protein [Burkholderiaceae bacterium]